MNENERKTTEFDQVMRECDQWEHDRVANNGYPIDSFQDSDEAAADLLRDLISVIRTGKRWSK